MAYTECNVYLNDKLLGSSMRLKYKDNSQIKSYLKMTDAQSLLVLQEYSESNQLVQVVIDDSSKDKKYVADCSIAYISRKEYSPLVKYDVLFDIEMIREIQNEK